MSDKKVVFILSTGHSGSTLLTLILGSHTRVLSLGELIKLHKRIDKPYQDFPQLCVICKGECAFWNRQASFSVLQNYFSHQNKLYSIIRGVSHYHKSIYQHLFEWSGKEILVDSSKRVNWIRQQMHPASHWRKMSPKLLFLTRDGRAHINSILRKYPNRDAEQVIHKWKTGIEGMRDFYQNFAYDKAAISYEKLASQPFKAVRALCEFLEVDYQPEMLQYWKHEHHSCGGNLGTRSLIYKYRSQFSKNGTESRNKQIEEVKERHGNYYDEVGLAIRLDLRWKDELSKQQLQMFEAIAGETNKPFAHSG